MIDPVSIITDSWNYLIVVCLMMGGLFIVISQNNLVKKLVGLAIFQTSVFLFYITVGKMAAAQPPSCSTLPMWPTQTRCRMS